MISCNFYSFKTNYADLQARFESTVRYVPCEIWANLLKLPNLDQLSINYINIHAALNSYLLFIKYKIILSLYKNIKSCLYFQARLLYVVFVLIIVGHFCY